MFPFPLAFTSMCSGQVPSDMGVYTRACACCSEFTGQESKARVSQSGKGWQSISAALDNCRRNGKLMLIIRSWPLESGRETGCVQ